MPHDPGSGQTFGEWMRGGQPLREGKTVEVIPGGRTYATRDEVIVDTPRKKAVMDQLGHVVVERTDERGGYHRDVRINLR